MSSKDLIIVAVIVAAGLLFRILMHTSRPLRYRPCRLLTGSKLELFMLLREALPECIVCPQVALASLIVPLGIGAARKAGLEAIEKCHVGFAIFDQSMKLLAVVELDQHSRPARQALVQDTLLGTAGIRTLRFRAGKLPSPGRVRSMIFLQQRQSVRGLPRDRCRSIPKVHYEPATGPWQNTARLNL